MIAYRLRRSTREHCFSLDAFKALDYGRACQALGLRPSRPSVRADGSRARSKRRV